MAEMNKDCSKKKKKKNYTLKNKTNKKKGKAMTVKKYTRSLIEYVFKKIQNKNMQVSLRSNCFAHSYF